MIWPRGGLPRTIQPPNVAPRVRIPVLLRVRIPVLLIDGRNDFQAPLEAQAVRAAGNTGRHKKHVVLEGGHVPNDGSLALTVAILATAALTIPAQG